MPAEPPPQPTDAAEDDAEAQGQPREEAAPERVDAGHANCNGEGDGTDRDAMSVAAESPPRLAFPVVGVGASAGGLEAYTEFLSAVPPESGMALRP